MRRAAWINVVLGFWLVIAAFTLQSQTLSGVRMFNELIVGVLLLGSALWSLGAPRSPAAAATAGIMIGAWLVVSPFVLGYGSWNDVVCGAIAIVVALVSRQSMRARTNV